MTETRSSVLPRPRQLVEFGPHRGAHRVAVRAGVSVVTPLLVLWATGHLDLALYATFGSFTALYGRMHTHVSRLRMQLTAAAVLVGAVTIGTFVGTFAAREWIIVPVVAVCAGAAAFVSDALNWHPPGPLFIVFATAACASVPTEPSHVLLAFGVATAAAAFSLLIGALGLVHPAARRLPPVPFVVSFRAAARKPGELAHVLRYVVGIVIAGLIPTITGLGHPYWAMVSVVAALSGADATARLVRAGHRIIGTFAGLAVAALIFAVQPDALWTIVIVFCLQFCAELFVGRNYGLTMVFVTPMALAMVQLAHRVDGGALLLDRLVETAIGAAIGITITLLTHDRRSRAARA